MSVVGRAKEAVAKREKRITDAEHWYRRSYYVESNDPKDDPNVIETAFGLPKYGYQYVTEKSIDLFAKCNQLTSRQLSHKLWEVGVEYTNKLDGSEGGGGGGNPIYDDPKWTWNGTQRRRVVTGQSKWSEYTNDNEVVEGTIYDSTGILNSAFEPYTPPAEIDDFVPQLVFVRNEPIFNHKWMLYYINSVNKHRWYGWLKRTVKCSNIAGTYKIKRSGGRSYTYWEVSYTFQFNRETWDLFLLDIGSYYWQGGYDATTTVNIKKPFMEKGVPKLGLLTSDGGAASDITNPPVSRYNRYRVLSEIDFGRLMIPIPR